MLAALVLSDSIPLMTNSALSVGKKREKKDAFICCDLATRGGQGDENRLRNNLQQLCNESRIFKLKVRIPR